MPTYMHGLLGALGGRWREVDVLLKAAKDEETKTDQELHDVLCRAAIVLIAAHLEGFLRDSVRALVSDVNAFSSFKNCSSTIKRTFCSSFVVAVDEDSNSKAELLIQTFDGLDTKLTSEPFLFAGKHDDHRNASPTAIERICKNFGIKNVFALLAGSKLDDSFAGSPAVMKQIREDLWGHLDVAATNFPYAVDPPLFGLDQPTATVKGSRTLWETFLDNLMKTRHGIAHGSSQLNGNSVSEIVDMKDKVIVLQYGVALLLCKSAQ